MGASGGLPDGVVDLDDEPQVNIRRLAEAKGVKPSDVCACILDRPRHADLIQAVRKAGARIVLIGDGDIAGVMATTMPGTGIDIYLGQGGAPEGVLAAAALRCMGGQIQGRLIFRNEEERQRAGKVGITDLNRKYGMMELASGDVIFAATGVTDGSMLSGVHRVGQKVTTHSVSMRSASKTVRWLRTDHDLSHKPARD